jgi:hypothetical protein
MRKGKACVTFLILPEQAAVRLTSEHSGAIRLSPPSFVTLLVSLVSNKDEC